MSKKTSLAFIVMVVFCSLLLAAPPDFSGKWVLNKDQSEMRTRDGEKPDITMTIEQAADTLKVKQESSSEFMNREYSYKLNGETQEVEGRGGRMSKVTPKWEGDVLVVSTVREGQQGTTTSTERWQLSADGKTLTIAGKNQSPRGEFESKMIYQKQ
ncbi:MAG: hypothetical protein EHM23_15650 [Acidobacteria bacterium]|nr:MAG: hypothetical protein EHM23_15650 [Acidobacteriota bacterium]